MIAKFQKLFHSLLNEKHPEISEPEEKMLAIYGILYEAARSDQHVAPEEESKIKEIMERYFEIDDDAFDQVKAKAIALHQESPGFYQISREVRKHLAREERLALLDELWEVAYADGVIDPHELNLLRRLSDAIGLEHREFIDSRLKVSKKMK